MTVPPAGPLLHRLARPSAPHAVRASLGSRHRRRLQGAGRGAVQRTTRSTGTVIALDARDIDLTENPPGSGQGSFAVGTRVVYPYHGVARVLRREQRALGGRMCWYLVLLVTND